MNFAARFNEEFQKALEAKAFPGEKLSANWWKFAMNALRFASIMALGINPEDWNNLLTSAQTRVLTLYQFALLSNNLQKCTPHDLGLNLIEYHEVMQEADEYVKVWQELSTDLREEVTVKLNEEAKMQEAAEGVRPIMKPVKAEA